MTEKFKKFRTRLMKHFFYLCAVFLSGMFLFYCCYRYDNKYTYPHPPSRMGVIRLEDGWYREHPMFFLTEGWSFYQDKMLTPRDIQDHIPDAYLYIGRYGGFDLGDPDRRPHGRGTYRTVILTGDVKREYALELTRIYSRWRLWINGRLVQNVGLDGESPRPPLDMVTFTAAGPIEIVVEVEDDSSFYSGMVYPPAFGEPELVSRTGALRLLIHGSACIAALFIGVLCILLGAGCRFKKPYGALSFLCVSFFFASAWPVFQLAGQQDSWLAVAERAGYYGIFLSLIWIQGRICRLPGKMWYPACAAGIFICLTIFLEPNIQVATARPLYIYARVLAVWKWTAALWLLTTSFLAVRRSRPYSGTMLAGSCLFASALVMDRLTPVHEPVLTGWFVEVAGGMLILLVSEIVVYDMAKTYREEARLKMEKELARVQLYARARYAELQQEYIKETRRRLHETRNRITLIKHYVDRGEMEKLSRYLTELTGRPQGAGIQEYTGHSLLDAIFGLQAALAKESGIYMEIDGELLPGDLAVSDDDLTSLAMNLFNNACEACGRLPENGERWISVELKITEGNLMLSYANSALEGLPDGPEDRKRTVKDDWQAHGYGMEIMDGIARRYGGSLHAWHEDSCFTAEIILCHVAAIKA